MSVNNMTFEQVSNVLNEIAHQATGQAPIAITDTSTFISVAQTALLAGKDKVMNAISEILTRTIFAIRPYSAKMTGLEMDMPRWGAMTRKLSVADSDWSDDPAYEWPALYDASQNPATGDGEEIDPWTIKKPNILQTNFYGQSVYFDELTIFEDQLETAFTGPEQLGSFLGLIMTNLSNRLEMSNENLRRGLVCNAISAFVDEGNTDRVIHLVTEYNSITSESITPANVYDPANFPAFMKWMYARVAEICDLMTANSTKFQTVITGKPVLRHTPLEYQRVYMYSPLLRQMEARVLADAFHDGFLRYSDVEAIPYWQSINSKDSVYVKPVYTGTDGSVVVGNDAAQVNNVAGIIFDRDMMGMAITDRRILSTPVNTKGLYRNLHVHCKQKVAFDSTEKGVVLLLN